eukprot:TRINITY_DN22193_c0_g1_i1.p1 TRINITY_DN22193_c0_g1~~TRINITY_DN22193_c0_g1_i1.p1  ORF type:complete len:459 (+),score=70.77 TRINITY_DN22193_c0_g1_i1:186-1562(+)
MAASRTFYVGQVATSNNFGGTALSREALIPLSRCQSFTSNVDSASTLSQPDLSSSFLCRASTRLPIGDLALSRLVRRDALEHAATTRTRPNHLSKPSQTIMGEQSDSGNRRAINQQVYDMVMGWQSRGERAEQASSSESSKQSPLKTPPPPSSNFGANSGNVSPSALPVGTPSSISGSESTKLPSLKTLPPLKSSPPSSSNFGPGPGSISPSALPVASPSQAPLATQRQQSNEKEVEKKKQAAQRPVFVPYESAMGTSRAADDSKAHLVERSEFNAMRQRLNSKLSDANANIRQLRRTMQQREDEFNKYRWEVAALQQDLKVLSSIATDVAVNPAKASTVKINGRFVLSHLAFRLEELHGQVKRNAAGVEAMGLRDVPIEWAGMAEDVRVMGSFDDWTEGEQMSPETTGTYTKFTTTLRLRPGRYEIKFLVDGEWRTAPFWTTTGAGGLLENNLLIVD